MAQSVDGHSVKTKYFVSNYYVEKIVDNMKMDQERNMEKIENLLTSLSEKLEVIEEIKNKDLPGMNEWIEYSQKRITKVVETQFRNYNEAKALKLQRSCWDILLQNLKHKQGEKQKVKNMINYFRKY